MKKILEKYWIVIVIGGILILILTLSVIFAPWMNRQFKITISGVARSSDDRGVFLLDWRKHQIERISPPEILAKRPAWSHDGESLAFIYLTQLSLERSEGIGIFEKESKNVRLIHFGGPIDGEQIYTIAWSPDNQKILVCTWSNYDEDFWAKPNFYLLDLIDGKFSLIDLDLGKFQNKRPVNIAWSSLGELAIEVEGKLYISDIKTLKLEYITEGSHPFWTHDGKWLTFLCNPDKARFCKISPTENKRLQIPMLQNASISTNEYSQFSWSTDNRFIIFIERKGEGDPVYICILDSKTGLIHRVYSTSRLNTIDISVFYVIWNP